MTECCGDCRFWLRDRAEDGVCRRYAPKPSATAECKEMITLTFEPRWPTTFIDWWCGEFEGPPEPYSRSI